MSCSDPDLSLFVRVSDEHARPWLATLIMNTLSAAGDAGGPETPAAAALRGALLAAHPDAFPISDAHRMAIAARYAATAESWLAWDASPVYVPGSANGSSRPRWELIAKALPAMYVAARATTPAYERALATQIAHWGARKAALGAA